MVKKHDMAKKKTKQTNIKTVLKCKLQQTKKTWKICDL